MTSHVIAYRSLELLFGTHTFHFNCFFEDFNCVFTQIPCLSRVLYVKPNETMAINKFQRSRFTTPIYGKNPLNILFYGTKRQCPWDLVCSIGDVVSSRFAQMMNLA